MSNIDNFLRRFGDYLAKANESKKRGNNDYNPLLVIRSAKDEAKLHTRILHSFLDTNGAHYQDDLFLRFFLESLQLKGCEYKNLLEWFDDTANARVEKEYYITNECDKGFIDLYIYNDTKHIILENKVDSGDGDKQIAKYIDNLRENGYENIAVVYLTKIGDKLSDKSRDKWNIKENFLECGNDKVLYIPISYADEILEKWIGKCQSKSGVGNIANLNYALESYKDIVQIITGRKENTMSIADFFKDSKDFEMAFEILSNIDNIADKYLEQVADNISELLNKANKEKWIVSVEQKNNTQKAIVIAEDKFINNKQPFFYFCIFWYQKSRFYCNVYLETFNMPINDTINDVVSNICADILIPKYFDLEGIKCIEKDFRKDKEFGNSHITNADKIAFNFINNEAKKIRQLNEKIRELYL